MNTVVNFLYAQIHITYNNNKYYYGINNINWIMCHTGILLL